MTSEPDRYFIKVREVRSRYYGHPSTFEAQILRRRPRTHDRPKWEVVGRSRGHATREEAENGGTRLAARRRWSVETDPRKVRQAEFKDRYGDD